MKTINAAQLINYQYVGLSIDCQDAQTGTMNCTNPIHTYEGGRWVADHLCQQFGYGAVAIFVDNQICVGGPNANCRKELLRITTNV